MIGHLAAFNYHYMNDESTLLIYENLVEDPISNAPITLQICIQCLHLFYNSFPFLHALSNFCQQSLNTCCMYYIAKYTLGLKCSKLLPKTGGYLQVVDEDVRGPDMHGRHPDGVHPSVF